MYPITEAIVAKVSTTIRIATISIQTAVERSSWVIECSGPTFERFTWACCTSRNPNPIKAAAVIRPESVKGAKRTQPGSNRAISTSTSG